MKSPLTKTRSSSPEAATAAPGTTDNPVAAGSKALAISRALHRRVKAFCAHQGISIKTFSEEALQRYLAELAGTVGEAGEEGGRA